MKGQHVTFFKMFIYFFGCFLLTIFGHSGRFQSGRLLKPRLCPRLGGNMEKNFVGRGRIFRGGPDGHWLCAGGPWKWA